MSIDPASPRARAALDAVAAVATAGRPQLPGQLLVRRRDERRGRAGASLGRRLLDVGVVMYRTSTGEVVAMEDRCPHRAFPLSRGRLDGDRVVCGYHGFTFDAVRALRARALAGARALRRPAAHAAGAGAAAVRVDLARRAGARRAARARRRCPGSPTPAGPSAAARADVAANYLLLHENFADVTHVPIVHPEISPEVLHVAAPTLEIDLTETSVWYSRNYPATPLAPWQASATGLPGGEYEQRESGTFVSPALWVDAWEVFAPDPRDRGAPQLRRPLRPGGDARRRRYVAASSGGSAATSPRTPAG